MLHAWWVSSFLQASLLRMSSFRNGTKQNFRHKWLHQTIEPLFLSLSPSPEMARCHLKSRSRRGKKLPRSNASTRERASERPEIKAHSFLVSRQVASPLLLSSTGLQLGQDSDHCENRRRTCNSTTWIGIILSTFKIFWR